MVQPRLFISLLALALLTVNWRMTNTRIVTSKIPDAIEPNAIIRELQDQLSFIALNPVIGRITHVPTDPAAYEDEWFSARKAEGPVETYEVSGAIAFVPGVGPLGRDGIQFRTLLRNIESGVRTKADAPFGVSVRSHWSVQPTTTVGKEWTLSVERTVECVWWMMPFVTYTYDAVHYSVGGDLVKLAVMK